MATTINRLETLLSKTLPASLWGAYILPHRESDHHELGYSAVLPSHTHPLSAADDAALLNTLRSLAPDLLALWSPASIRNVRQRQLPLCI